METIVKNAKDANIQVSNFQTVRTKELRVSLKDLYDANQEPAEIAETLRNFKAILMVANALKEIYSGNELEKLPKDLQRFLGMFNMDFNGLVGQFDNIELMERFLEGFAVESKARNEEFDWLTKDF